MAAHVTRRLVSAPPVTLDTMVTCVTLPVTRDCGGWAVVSTVPPTAPPHVTWSMVGACVQLGAWATIVRTSLPLAAMVPGAADRK